jgi:hypothetical protein
MTRVLADLNVPERLFPVRQVLSVIDRAKNQGIDAAAFQPTDYFDDVVARPTRSTRSAWPPPTPPTSGACCWRR